MVDLRINKTCQTGAVENRTYRGVWNAVRLGNRTYPDKLGSKPRGESVYLFWLMLRFGATETRCRRKKPSFQEKTRFPLYVLHFLFR